MFVETLIKLLIVLPLLASVLITLSYVFKNNRGESGEKLTTNIVLLFLTVTFISMLVVDVLVLNEQVLPTIMYTQWLASGSLNIELILQLDIFALVMATLIILVALIVAKFSVNYLHREKGYQHFFIILLLFTTAMLLLVLAGNAITMFVAWELAGVSSYLLIGFAINRNTATRNANQAFISNRIGDAGFIMGIFLCYQHIGGVGWTQITSASIDPVIAIGIMCSFLLAIVAKSAQIPFSPWITKALEGPTPSSAIFYGALMVHAGVYLLIRLAPLFSQSGIMMVLLVIIGLFTAFYAYFSGLVQTDIKSNLMFSTLSQVGLMVATIGLGYVELAQAHMVLHIMWRTYQFLHAPAIMHQMQLKMRQVNPILYKNNWLFTASLQRFWLDHVAQSLLIRPTKALAKDFAFFEEHFVAKLTGLPKKLDFMLIMSRNNNNIGANDIGFGRGIAGQLMEKIAIAFEWFENNLILKAGGDGLLSAINRIGKYLIQIDILLTQPRYLMLIIMATLVVIL